MAVWPRVLAAIVFMFLTVAVFQAEAWAQERHALLIGGLGGDADNTERFLGFLRDTDVALQAAGVAASQITVLAEAAGQEQPYVDGLSNDEGIRAAFQTLNQRVGVDDEVIVMLFGHGSMAGGEARFNIPRRDLAAADYAALLTALPTSTVRFVNTASSSGPFVEALSAPDRLVLTATRSGQQRNQTRFPDYFVEALQSNDADLNRDGNRSWAELFQFAAEATLESFRAENKLPSEIALLDADGDGTGMPIEELDDTLDAEAGARLWFSQGQLAQALATATGSQRQQLEALIVQQRTLEDEVAAVRATKASADEDEYYDALEDVLIRLARLSDEIDAVQGQ
ncbi:MAG: hypothetical protein AAF730_03605 [Bacteroidota bacterium]